MAHIGKKVLRHKLLAGIMAAVFAVGMSVPAFAATQIDYTTDGDSETITKTEAFTDDSAGLSWDGADAVTMSDASLYSVYIDGDATIQLEGESTVEEIRGDGDFTIQGDTDAAAEDKPVLNLGGIDEEGEGGLIYASGSLTISGATINTDAEAYYTEIFAGDDLTIDQSKVAAIGGDLYIIANWGAVTISESEVDLGTDEAGGICSNGDLTIDNSNVSIRFSDPDYPWDEAIHSHGGEIILENMANGEVHEGGAYGSSVVSGDSDGIFLKAAGTPGYYKQAEESEDAPASKGGGLPATGDAAGLALVGFAAAATCALGAAASARRRARE